MKIIEKGNYKKRDWSIRVECTGYGWKQKHKPCYSILELEDGDIVMRRYGEWDDEIEIEYGFICPICQCFTEINKDRIPIDVQQYCNEVASKDSRFYEYLNEAEKKLSEPL